jgi:hypothetical protein
MAAVDGAHGNAPEAVLEALLQAVRAFTANAAPHDDLTAMVVRYRGRGSPAAPPEA